MLCIHQWGPAWTRKNHICRLGRCDPRSEFSGGCGRDILALPPMAEHDGDLVSSNWPAISLWDLVWDKQKELSMWVWPQTEEIRMLQSLVWLLMFFPTRRFFSHGFSEAVVIGATRNSKWNLWVLCLFNSCNMVTLESDQMVAMLSFLSRRKCFSCVEVEDKEKKELLPQC